MSHVDSTGAVHFGTSPDQTVSRVRVFHWILSLAWLGMAAASLWWGIEYYASPLVERPFMEDHELLKPSGLIGHGFGIVGSLFMIIGVAMYSTRKRVGSLARLGKLGRWLDVHIFLCTMGPLLVLLHTTFKFGGIVSISVWCMLAVVFSGVFGRYVYSRIPKSVDGQFLSPEVLDAYALRLDRKLQEVTALGTDEVQFVLSRAGLREPKGLGEALFLSARKDLTRRSRRDSIRRALDTMKVDPQVRPKAHELLDARVNMQIDYAIRRPMVRMFGYWHVFHLPLAVVMFLVMIFHIVVVAAFGYLWIF